MGDIEIKVEAPEDVIIIIETGILFYFDQMK